jgi:hypothetical protein
MKLSREVSQVASLIASYDVFISYRHADAAESTALLARRTPDCSRIEAAKEILKAVHADWESWKDAPGDASRPL